MIVTAHPPGYLPSVSVMSKLAQADVVIWLDDVRFTTPGWINRNQLPNGTWLTVPVERENHRSTIREVTIAEGPWALEHMAKLLDVYEEAPHFDPYIGEVLRGTFAAAGEPLVDLNLELLEWLINSLGLQMREFRQSDYPAAGGSLSSKLVRMVKEVGGTTYLSGPTSRLDPDHFRREGVELTFFSFAGSNPSVVDPLFRTGILPTGRGAPRQAVRSA